MAKKNQTSMRCASREGGVPSGARCPANGNDDEGHAAWCPDGTPVAPPAPPAP